MSVISARPLRVALLRHDFDEPDADHAAEGLVALAEGLARIGHKPVLVATGDGRSESQAHGSLGLVRIRRLPEAPLRLRGFAVPLTQIPFGVAALRHGRFDIAHAFSCTDAQAALAWRRLGGCPVVYTCTEPPARETLADRRGRLWMTWHAFERSDAVTAASVVVRDAVKRWLARDVEVVGFNEAATYEAIYRASLGGRWASGGARSDPDDAAQAPQSSSLSR